MKAEPADRTGTPQTKRRSPVQPNPAVKSEPMISNGCAATAAAAAVFTTTAAAAGRSSRGLGHVDGEGATVHVLAVHAFDGLLGLFGACSW